MDAIFAPQLKNSMSCLESIVTTVLPKKMFGQQIQSAAVTFVAHYDEVTKRTFMVHLRKKKSLLNRVLDANRGDMKSC